LLLALQAVRVTYQVDGSYTKEAVDALHQAVQAASRLQLTLAGHVNPRGPVTFSSDGSRVVGLDFDDRSKIWDAATGEELLAVAGTDAILTGDGRRLITLLANEDSQDYSRMVWDTTTGEALGGNLPSIHLEQERVLPMLALSPEGAYLVAGYQDGLVAIWDFSTGTTVHLTEHSHRINDLDFSADGAYLATASSDGSARIWQLTAADGTPAASLPSKFTVSDPAGELVKVALSANGSRLVTVNDRFTASVWELDNVSGGVALLSTFSLGSHNGPIEQVTFSPNGSWLASAGGNKVILWEVTNGSSWLTLPGGASKIAFSPDGTRLLTTDANAMKVWDLTPAGSKEKQTLAGHSGFVYGADFSPDGTRLATAGIDGQAFVWDWAAGTRLVTLTGHIGPVQDIQFSPDELRLATAGHDSTARLWNAMSGLELFSLPGHGPGTYRPFFEGVFAVVFSPDGARLASAGLDGTVRLWHTGSGAPGPILLHDSPVKGVAFRPDGTMLVTAESKQTFHGWDAHSGESLFTVSAPAEVLDVAFDPSGQRLVVSLRDTSLRLWEVDTLLNASQDTAGMVAGDGLALLGHTTFPLSVGFSPDGRQMASIASAEIKVWDLITGLEMFSLPAGDSPYAATSLTFSPDGRYLAAGKSDGTVHFYVLVVEELVALAQSRLTRGWTLAECIHYHIDPCPTAP
jgi:WD40 repeat protein